MRRLLPSLRSFLFSGALVAALAGVPSLLGTVHAQGQNEPAPAAPSPAAAQPTTQAPPTFHLDPRIKLSPETQRCLTCHTDLHRNLFVSWKKGLHAEKGIGCYECHQAGIKDPDAIADHNGFTISPLVTPKDCGRCHQEQAQSFLNSYHAKGALILRDPNDPESLDGMNPDVFFGAVIQGQASFLQGCDACHGSKITLHKTKKTPLPESYPNFGIGRLNPDGTAGTCSACHQRHEFRMDQARKAETCGRCHLGPDHAQLEIWKESKHGVAFDTSNTGVNLSQRPLLLGRHRQVVPTCATCHVGATTSPEALQSHDPGKRLSWRSAPEIATRTVDWQEKRLSMQTVCLKCHSPKHVQGHFLHFDKAIALYNHKFALPGKTLMEKLRAAKKLDSAPFNEEIERTWFSIWHHEGRRARMGAAMMGADHVQWHGFFEVAKKFYLEFIPQAEALQPGITDEILARPEHAWYKISSHSHELTLESIKANLKFWEETAPDVK